LVYIPLSGFEKEGPRLKKILLHSWPLYAAILCFLLLVWVLVAISIVQNHGNLVYALDDPYIHMAMAKNFSQSGVWGVTHYGYTPTSSSLLWTLLLSATYYLGGVNQLAPLLWNLVFTVLILVVADVILTWYQTPTAIKFIALLALILLVPLPVLVLSGMEQGLQTLLTLLTVFLAARLLSGESPASARADAIKLLILAPLVTAARFEGMFLIATLCGLFLLFARWRYAAAFAACGFLPVVLNGVISVSKGWFWFPTSVLLKASLPDFHSPVELILSLLNPIFVNLREGLHILVLLVAVLLFYIMACAKGSGSRESRQIVGTILVITGITHLEFVGVSPLYRYDAYWCALAFLYLAVQLPVVVPRWSPPFALSTWTAQKNLACGVLFLLLLFPLLVKGGRIFWFLPQCTTNIYEQQYQMGLFVRRYYQHSTVALNDIGAVNFLADIHCLDLWGLANADIAAAKRNHTYQVPDIDRLSKQTGARIAIIYDSWFEGGLPSGWVRVGRWTIRNNVIAGGDTVSFYAVNLGETPHLVESLTDFASRLPADVIQRGH
jgi:hypothetical protein